MEQVKERVYLVVRGMKAIKESNKTFKFLKRTLTPEAATDYQKKRAYVIKAIKNTKKTA